MLLVESYQRWIVFCLIFSSFDISFHQFFVVVKRYMELSTSYQFSYDVNSQKKTQIHTKSPYGWTFRTQRSNKIRLCNWLTSQSKLVWTIIQTSKCLTNHEIFCVLDWKVWISQMLDPFCVIRSHLAVHSCVTPRGLFLDIVTAAKPIKSNQLKEFEQSR